jgi:hypothetical protein
MIRLNHSIRRVRKTRKKPVIGGRRAPESAAGAEPRWLLLFHQIPPNPAYVRVKVGRRLARVGAISLKNTVYVLPRSEAALEDLQWVLREVVASGGDATLCEARFVDGLTDDEVERRFQEARDEDYRALLDEIRTAVEAPPDGNQPANGSEKLKADAIRFQRRFEEIGSIDFFNAPGREGCAGLLRALAEKLENNPTDGQRSAGSASRSSYLGKVWVTRVGVHVDRIASAWLVRRFIDPKPEFKFVSPRGYRPGKNDVRFDMFEAEFTHEGDLCTFEVLLQRFSVKEPGLAAIGEVIHDIDIKDSKFERPETSGVAAMIAGLCIASHSDEERLTQGFVLFDQLQAYFARRKR